MKIKPIRKLFAPRYPEGINLQKDIEGRKSVKYAERLAGIALMTLATVGGIAGCAQSEDTAGNGAETVRTITTMQPEHSHQNSSISQKVECTIEEGITLGEPSIITVTTMCENTKAISVTPQTTSPIKINTGTTRNTDKEYPVMGMSATVFATTTIKETITPGITNPPPSKTEYVIMGNIAFPSSPRTTVILGTVTPVSTPDNSETEQTEQPN